MGRYNVSLFVGKQYATTKVGFLPLTKRFQLEMVEQIVGKRLMIKSDITFSILVTTVCYFCFLPK